MLCPQCGLENPGGTIACLKCATPLPLHDMTATAGVAAGWSLHSTTGAAAAIVRAPAVLEPGSVIGNRYEVVQLLGEGGMGAVYKVRDREVDRFVALKVIRSDLANRPEILQRFKQELILARQVTHKNVIRIFDLGEADGLKFITMDFVDGRDLKMLLRERGKFPPEEAVKIIAQVCRALDAAHSEGVVHRDLKPQNIMLDGQGRVTVMDFGIARSLEQPGMTQTGALMGTPEYMSPEQAKGETVDARSDLFALGIILYELLTGKTPFHADTALATMLKRTQERARPPVELEPTIPSELSNVVMKCLQIDREQRYLSALDVLHALGQQTVTLTRPEVAVPPRPAWLQQGLRYWKWIAAALAVVILAAAAFLFRSAISRGPRAKGPAGESVSLAILPLRNAAGDASLDWLGSSLAEMLRTDVGQSSNLHTVPPDRLHQILSDLRVSPDAELDPATLRRIAEFTNADQLVWGQYVKLGSAIRVDVTLQDMKRQRATPLKMEASDEKALISTVDQLAHAIQEHLALAPSAVQELKAAAFTPSSQSVEALREYSEGLELARDGNHLGAAKKFEAATRADPNFALAYSMLGQTDADLGYGKQAEQYSSKAVDLSANLPAAEKYMIQAANARIENNYDRAVEAYDNLIKLMPNDPKVESDLAALYEAKGAYDKAYDYYAKVVESDPKNADALLAIGWVQMERGSPQGSVDYLNRALSLAVELSNQQGKANALQALGAAYRLTNKPDDALQNLEQALAIEKQISDNRGLEVTLGHLAEVYRVKGRPEEATKYYQDALSLEKKIGDQLALGGTSLNFGNFLVSEGKYDEALELTKQALQIELQLGDESSQAMCLNNIGDIYFRKGQYDEALTYFQRGLDLRRKFKVFADIARSLNNVGETYLKLGRLDEALDNYLHALELSRSAGDKLNVAMTSDSMAGLFEIQGRYGAALNAQQDALNTIRQMREQTAYLAEIEANYGNALTLVGRGDEAQKSLEEAINLARSLRNNSLVGKITDFQGESSFYRGDFKSARPLFEQALQVALREKDRSQVLIARLNLARLSIKEGHAAAAAQSLKGLAKDADSMGQKYLSTQCSLYLGEALVESRDYSQARQNLEATLRKSQDLGMKSLLPQVHYWLAMGLRGGGNKAEAVSHLQQAAQLVEDMHRESRSDAILERDDLKPITQEAIRKAP